VTFLPVVSLAAAALAASSADPPPQEERVDCPVTIRFDAHTGSAVLLQGKEERLIDPALPVRTSEAVCLLVVGVSTALQRVEFQDTPVDTTGATLLASTFRGPVPDLAELAGRAMARLRETAIGPVLFRGEAASLAAAVKRATARVEKLLAGPGSLKEVRGAVLVALGQMAADLSASEKLAALLRARLGPALVCQPRPDGPCEERLRISSEINIAFAELDAALATVSASGERDAEVTRLVEHAQELLVAYGTTMAAVRETEDLVAIALAARSSVRFGPVSASWYSGRDLRLFVMPRTEPQALAPLAPRGATNVSFRVMPTQSIRLGFGLGLLYVPAGESAIYGTVNGVVAQTGSNYVRVLWAASLALTYSGIDWRDSGGPTIWFPDLVVAPFSEAGPVIGGGVALSWKFLKAGAGVVWMRTEILNGVSVGDPVGVAETVPVDYRYSTTPRLYLQLAFQLSELIR